MLMAPPVIPITQPLALVYSVAAGRPERPGTNTGRQCLVDEAAVLCFRGIPDNNLSCRSPLDCSPLCRHRHQRQLNLIVNLPLGKH